MRAGDLGVCRRSVVACLCCERTVSLLQRFHSSRPCSDARIAPSSCALRDTSLHPRPLFAHHPSPSHPSPQVWATAVETAEAKTLLPLLYIANDVLQRTKDLTQRSAYIAEFAKCVFA